MVEQIIAELINGLPIPLRNAGSVCKGSGLYAIEENHELIYVGLGSNLSKRLKQHLRLNARGSMFAYRYMLKELGGVEPSCPTKQKNLLRQRFKLAHVEERKRLSSKVASLNVRTATCPKHLLRSIERQVIEKLKPKLNRHGK